MKLCLTAMMIALSLATQSTAQLSVVPAVQQWTPAEGALKLTAQSCVIQINDADNPPLANVAEQLQSDLLAIGFGKVTIASAPTPSPHCIFLQLTPPNPTLPHPTEAYTLSINQHVTLSAPTPTGVFYATRTLLQMLRQNPAQLPCGLILDYPLYNRRMLMLDVGRKPFPIDALKDYLRILAWYKMNELHLHLSDESFGGQYTGFRVECSTYPGLTSKDCSYSKQDLRQLQDLAKQLGITITPEIDMPGHARVFTDLWPDLRLKTNPSYLDVTNPQTLPRLKKLLDEMIPLFDAPDFHIGTDEYRVSGTKEERTALHESFRQFINSMNAHIRSKGKNTRIWSGFEHMLGTTEIDPTVIIDMWETDDAKSQIAKGHKIINSNHGRTYIVPGAHYYGVSNTGIYQNWEPWMVSGDMSKNPAKTDPNLLGGKLHVWNDQGPSGYTLTEIATLALPSIQAFSEKLWGTKGSKDYPEFQSRAAATLPIPTVTLTDRLSLPDNDGLVLQLDAEQSLPTPAATIPLPLANADRADLENPWTLSFQIYKTQETGQRGVILSSKLVEICSDFSTETQKKTKNPAGKEIQTKISRHGVGLIRSAGSFGQDPASSMKRDQVSQVYTDPLPLNQWITLTIVATPGRTTLYLNGKKTGESNNQMVCPLRHLGSPTGQSFVGKIRNLKLWNRALPDTDLPK